MKRIRGAYLSSGEGATLGRYNPGALLSEYKALAWVLGEPAEDLEKEKRIQLIKGLGEGFIS